MNKTAQSHNAVELVSLNMFETCVEQLNAKNAQHSCISNTKTYI